MHKSVLAVMVMLGFIPQAHADKPKEESRIYQTDSIGTIQADKSHYVIQKDGRILPTDSIGTKIDGSKDQYKIIGDRIYETDSIGTVHPDKSQKIK